MYFISPFEGAFESFAHIAQDNVPELADYIHGRLWDAGIRHGECVVEGRWHLSGSPPPEPPKPKEPTRKLYDYIALCQIFASQPPVQVMESIAESLGDNDPPLTGASTVIGGFHLLVELGGDDREALNGYVATLSDVPGVERVEAGFAAREPPQADRPLSMTEDRLAGPARSGERKLVTLLFADLSGYTALVASMDPEEAYAFVRPGMRMTPNGPCGRASPSGTTLASCAAAGAAPRSPRSTRASRPAR